MIYNIQYKTWVQKTKQNKKLTVLPWILGIGYLQLIRKVYVFTYVIVQVWALFYLVFSFRSQLPWATCNNTWNTGNVWISLFSDLNNMGPHISEFLFVSQLLYLMYLTFLGSEGELSIKLFHIILPGLIKAFNENTNGMYWLTERCCIAFANRTDRNVTNVCCTRQASVSGTQTVGATLCG